MLQLCSILVSLSLTVAAGSECPSMFPLCDSAGNCVVSSCADGCSDRIESNVISARSPGDSNYIRGYDGAGSKCLTNYQQVGGQWRFLSRGSKKPKKKPRNGGSKKPAHKPTNGGGSSTRAKCGRQWRCSPGFQAAPAEVCRREICTRAECCQRQAPVTKCQASDCGSGFKLKYPLLRCSGVPCTQSLCCDEERQAPVTKCQASDCGRGFKLKHPLKRCPGATCTQRHCCDEERQAGKASFTKIGNGYCYGSNDNNGKVHPNYCHSGKANGVTLQGCKDICHRMSGCGGLSWGDGKVPWATFNGLCQLFLDKGVDCPEGTFAPFTSFSTGTKETDGDLPITKIGKEIQNVACYVNDDYGKARGKRNVFSVRQDKGKRRNKRRWGSSMVMKLRDMAKIMKNKDKAKVAIRRAIARKIPNVEEDDVTVTKIEQESGRRLAEERHLAAGSLKIEYEINIAEDSTADLAVMEADIKKLETLGEDLSAVVSANLQAEGIEGVKIEKLEPSATVTSTDITEAPIPQPAPVPAPSPTKAKCNTEDCFLAGSAHSDFKVSSIVQYFACAVALMVYI